MKKPWLCAVLFSFACGGGGESPTTPTTSTGSCSTLGQVTYVRDRMVDIYLWYREVPNLNVASFSSPEAYLEAARYRQFDTSFSFIISRADYNALFLESSSVAIGITYVRTGEADLRLTEVQPGSPAGDAGLERGDYLVAVNGKTVAELLQTGEISTIFGPRQAGVAVDLVWRKPAGGELRATLVKRTITIPTVRATRVLDVGGMRVGYVFYRDFIQPSVDPLNAAFAEMAAAGATELILDLRYNPGGDTSVMQHLAGLLAGARAQGQVFVEFSYNDKNTSRNTVQRFTRPAAALSLSRLVVITTRTSASASESIINGLRPYIPVVVVGDTTYGKPVGQAGFEFCESLFFPVSFVVRNARGEGDYFGGIPADCAAGDDLDHPLGEAAEASTAEAINYLRSGSCSGRSAEVARVLTEREARWPQPPVDPWQQFIGLY
jgi:C-terminal processing protease CtpA/Prc